jgi:dolichyl-phosphate beta-glucosyltransferase
MCWRIKDSQRGFKCFTAQAAGEIFPRQTIMRWGFDIEILALAKKLGFKIKEVPIIWENVGKSEVNLKSYLKTLGELFKIKWNLISGKYNVSK